MTVQELAQTLSLTLLAGKEGLDREITGCYAGDLLSWVMARAESGALVGRGNNRMIFGYCKLTCRLDNGFNKLFCSNRWAFGIHKAIGHGIAWT